MPRCGGCGAAGAGCSCLLVGSASALVTGTGEAGSPYTVAAKISADARNRIETLLDGLFVRFLPTGEYYAEDAGAKFDGTTDDTAAIQAKINEAAAAGGGTVWLPKGTAIVTNISVKPRVYLRGLGMFTTILKQKANSTGPVVRAHYSSDAGATDPNGQFIGVFDLQIDGNRANQTAPNHGLHLEPNPPTPAVKPAADLFWDSHNLVQNVRITECKGNGVYSAGRSENRLINVVVYKVDLHAFQVHYDTWLIGCTGSWAGLAGFYMKDTSSCIVADCKAFYNGQTTPASGYGFIYNNCHSMVCVGNQSQDNRGGGYQLDNNCKNIELAGCVADSNSTSGIGTYPAYDLWDSSYNTLVACAATERRADGTNSWQRNALRVRNNSFYNKIFINHVAVNGATIGSPLAAAAVQTNHIEINGSRCTASELLTYAVSITPDWSTASVKFITLTGNLTLANPTVANPPPGTRMAFVLTQDATGGRTVTFGSAFKVSGFQIAIAGSTVAAIEFVFDGTNWIQAHQTHSGHLGGRPVATTAPTAGQALVWNNTLGQWEPGTVSGGAVTLAGDVTGPSGTTVVEKVRGRTVAATAPANGQALVWNNTLSQWEPTTLAGATSMRSFSKTVVSGSGAVGTWNADYTCDFTDDHVEIQAAIDAVAAAGGGEVKLSEGFFKINVSLKMKTGVRLVGSGWATRIRPGSTAFVGNALIEPFDINAHAWAVKSLMLDSNGITHPQGYLHGIYMDGLGGDFAPTIPTDPDPGIILEDLFIYNTKGQGILCSDDPTDGEAGTAFSDMRGCYLHRIWVLFYRDVGINWHGVDSFLNACVVGGSVSSSVGSGFVLAGGNNRLVNSKAYYAKKHGLRVTGQRGVVSAFEAQDNGWHGVSLEGNRNSLSGLVLDSNGRDKVNNGGVGDGISIAGSRCSVLGFVAFDRAQTPASPQRCGINFAGGSDNIIMGSVEIANMVGVSGIRTHTGSRTGQTMFVVTTDETSGGQPMDEARFGAGRMYIFTPTAAPAAADLGNNNTSPWFDNVTNELVFVSKKNDGTLRQARIATSVFP